MTFNRSGLLELQHQIYPRLLTGFGMLVIFKRKSHGISVQIFGLISSCLSNRRLRVVLEGKFYQEYPGNGVVLQGSILGPTLLLLSIFIILSITLLSMLMVLLSTLSVIRHLICGNNQKWLLNLNLIDETLDWCRKWLVDFNAGKTQLLSFD